MKKTVSIILCLCVAVSCLFALSFVTVFAEAQTYSFTDLRAENKVKIQGRSKDDFVTAYWSANAVDLNIDTAGGDVTVKINTTEPVVYFEAFVDGQSIGRSNAPARPDNPDITFSGVPAGKHLLRIARETGTSKDITAFTFFDSITFDGTVLERPADTDMYVEIIGDSVATGAGVLGVFGDDHKTEYHSCTHSFGYYIAEDLKADYSIVAAGGVGLYELSPGKKEWYDGVPVNIQKMYEYTNGVPDFDVEENKYDFPRKPDLIVIRIGANDDTLNESQWRKDFSDFVIRLHEINGKNVPIVFSGKAGTPHYISVQSAKSQELKDHNVYLVSTVVGGSGTAALKTQKSGHPNVAEQRALADSIMEVIRKNGLDKPIDHSEDEKEAEKEGEEDGSDSTETVGAASGKTNYYLYGGIAAGVIVIAVIIIAAVASKKKKAAKPEEKAEPEDKPEDEPAEEAEKTEGPEKQ